MKKLHFFGAFKKWFIPIDMKNSENNGFEGNKKYFFSDFFMSFWKKKGKTFFPRNNFHNEEKNIF